MLKKEQIFKIIKENIGFVFFLICMAVYYTWRMFALDPWYDELYTYYSFISKGPIYSAIHWPLPNNHVMFSVVSSFLDIFGNSYISLRGISLIASVANLVLLYCLAQKFMNKVWSLGCTALYACFYMVNYISIQGRGYTMAISFYLIALLMLYKICVEKKDKLLYYIIFSLCLTWGLYSIIWLAIGSNLLSKTADSGYYGIYQVKIILTAPFKALKTGMDYMLASPYVQSIDRGEMLATFSAWLISLFNLFVNNMGKIILFLLIVAFLGSLIWGKKMFDQKDDKRLFLYVYMGTMIFMIPLILIVQSALPYHRVFTFLGVLFALGLFAFLTQWVGGIGNWIVCGLCLACCTILLTSGYYKAPYADREVEIQEIWKQSGIEGSPEGICYIDDYQKYVLQFYWGYRPTESWQEEARYILMPKEVMEEDYKAKVWPILYTNEEINWDALTECKVVTETDSYVLYQRDTVE